MPRPQQPWYRKQTGWWMVEIGGKQEKLVQGPKDEEHRRLAVEKMVELQRLRRKAPHAADARTADIIDAFLIASRRDNAPDTYRIHKYYCQRFAEHCGTVPAREIKPYHVSAWLAEMMSPDRVKREKEDRRRAIEAGEVERRKQGRQPKEWGPSSAYNARMIAFRVFSWAMEEGLLEANPLAGMKRPKPPPRQRAMSDDEFRRMYEHAGGPFADFLLALRETGARPKEVRDLVWAQVQADRWVLTKHKTARKVGKPRVVFLSAAMRELMARLRGNGHSHVFLNTEGKPWTTNAVRLQIGRLRAKLGLRGDLCAYLARHGFGTRAILNGVNPMTVAELMGHTSLDMVSKVYVHLADEHEHLRDAVEQVNSAAATPAPAVADRVRKTRAGATRRAEQGPGPSGSPPPASS